MKTNNTTLTVPVTEWNQMKRDMATLVKANEANSYIGESQVCELLGISKKTLSNYISSEKIPSNYYKIGVGNNRFYDKGKIMGINDKI